MCLTSNQILTIDLGCQCFWLLSNKPHTLIILEQTNRITNRSTQARAHTHTHPVDTYHNSILTFLYLHFINDFTPFVLCYNTHSIIQKFQMKTSYVEAFHACEIVNFVEMMMRNLFNVNYLFSVRTEIIWILLLKLFSHDFQDEIYRY